MHAERYLDTFEEFVLRAREWGPPVTIAYRGSIDPSMMASAFEELCVRHPVIRGRISETDKGYILSVSPGHQPQFKVLAGDQSTLWDAVEKPWDSSIAVVQLILVHNPSGGYVSLRMSHSIFDARSGWAIFRDFWRLYNNLVNGVESNEIETHEPLPKSPCKLLSERWPNYESLASIGMGVAESIVVMDRRRRGAVKSELRPGRPNPKRRIRLDREVTVGLITAARTHETTLHALVCGSILSALRGHEKPTTPARMTCMSVVDFRDLLTPPVGDAETTNLLGVHSATVFVTPARNPIDIGVEVKQQLSSAIRDMRFGTVTQVAAAEQDTVPFAGSFRAVAVSNAGRVPDLAHPREMEIVDFLMATPRREDSAPNPWFGVFTFCESLNIVCVYPAELSDREVGHYTDLINERLTGMSESQALASI